MEIRELPAGAEHERVVECVDDAAGYHGVIAIHSTRLGPAIGGTRLWPYRTLDEAVTDAMRLSRGMTYKSALAGLSFGGGKSVILGSGSTIDREHVFRAHGRFIDRFHGQYITGEDVGTTPADMAVVRLETPHAAGLPHASGDPSPFTARGIFRAMQAGAFHRWGSPSLRGRRVAIQGCGSVGYRLALELSREGADLFASDLDGTKVTRLVVEAGATRVEPEAIFDVDADVFAPCALGAILNDQTIPRLLVELVCGGANNQLAEDRHGSAVEARGILYVPDYVANAGGLINGVRDFGSGGASSGPAIEAIYDTTLRVIALAASQGVTTAQAADRLAEIRLHG